MAQARYFTPKAFLCPIHSLGVYCHGDSGNTTAMSANEIKLVEPAAGQPGTGWPIWQIRVRGLVRAGHPILSLFAKLCRAHKSWMFTATSDEPPLE